MRHRDTSQMIVIDSLGKMAKHGYGVGGYCLDCRVLFDVDLVALIAERGAAAASIRMPPLTCFHCGGRRTQVTVIAPRMGTGPRSEPD